MISCICTERYYDRNGIIKVYTIADRSNKRVKFDSNTLKKYIAHGVLNVLNLKLTSDNRLLTDETRYKITDIHETQRNGAKIENKEPEQRRKLPYEKILQIAKMSGDEVRETVTVCGNKVIEVIDNVTKTYTLYIPDEVTMVNKWTTLELCQLPSDYSVKIVGGHNVIIADEFLSYVPTVKILDLTDLDFGRCLSAESAFSNIYANEGAILKSFDVLRNCIFIDSDTLSIRSKRAKHRVGQEEVNIGFLCQCERFNIKSFMPLGVEKHRWLEEYDHNKMRKQMHDMISLIDKAYKKDSTCRWASYLLNKVMGTIIREESTRLYKIVTEGELENKMEIALESATGRKYCVSYTHEFNFNVDGVRCIHDKTTKIVLGTLNVEHEDGRVASIVSFLKPMFDADNIVHVRAEEIYAVGNHLEQMQNVNIVNALENERKRLEEIVDTKMQDGPNANNIRNISRLLSTYNIAKTLQ